MSGEQTYSGDLQGLVHAGPLKHAVTYKYVTALFFHSNLSSDTGAANPQGRDMSV